MLGFCFSLTLILNYEKDEMYNRLPNNFIHIAITAAQCLFVTIFDVFALDLYSDESS